MWELVPMFNLVQTTNKKKKKPVRQIKYFKMAGQILMVLATQSHNIRAFFRTNEEPLLRLGLGTLSCYLGLLALSKSYEAKKLSDELAGQAIHFRATKDALTDENWLQKASTMVLEAALTEGSNSNSNSSTNGGGGSADRNKNNDKHFVNLDSESVRVSTMAALRKEIEAAFIQGERRGVQEARAREWMPELSLPRTDAVKEARERRDALLTTSRRDLVDERRAIDKESSQTSKSIENSATLSVPATNFKRSGLI
jgi:hypothetical protein